MILSVATVSLPNSGSKTFNLIFVVYCESEFLEYQYLSLEGTSVSCVQVKKKNKACRSQPSFQIINMGIVQIHSHNIQF